MDSYYPYTWLSFLNHKNEKKKKKKKWEFVNENSISTVPKVLLFKTTDLYTVYLFSAYVDN